MQLCSVNSSVPGTARLPIWQDTLIRGLSLFLSTGWREPKTLGIAGRLADNYDTSLETAIAKVPILSYHLNMCLVFVFHIQLVLWPFDAQLVDDDGGQESGTSTSNRKLQLLR